MSVIVRNIVFLVQLPNGKSDLFLKYLEGFPCTNFCSFDIPNDFKVSEAGNFSMFTVGYWDTNACVPFFRSQLVNMAVAKAHVSCDSRTHPHSSFAGAEVYWVVRRGGHRECNRSPLFLLTHTRLPSMVLLRQQQRETPDQDNKN